jgi:hypothetical protein
LPQHTATNIHGYQQSKRNTCIILASEGTRMLSQDTSHSLLAFKVFLLTRNVGS